MERSSSSAMELSVSSLGRALFGGLNCPFDRAVEISGSLAWILRGYCCPVEVPMADAAHDWDLEGGGAYSVTS